MPDRRLLAWALLGAAACADRYEPSAADLEAPYVIATDPVADAPDVGRRPAIAITFSEPVDPATIHGASLRLIGPAGVVEASMEVAGAVARLVPAADLREGEAYRVVVARQIRDLAGVPLAGESGVESDFSFRFRTAAVPPAVTSILPAQDEAWVAWDPAPQVVIRFSEPMDPETIARHVVLRDEALLVPAAVGCDADCSTITLTPEAPLREGRLHQVEIAATAADASGIPMGAPVVGRFTTGRDAPTLVAIDPAQGATGVATFGVVAAVQASERLEPASVAPGNVTVTPPALFRISWDETGRLIRISFPEPLTSNVTWRVRLGTGITDDDGNPLAAPFELAFSTGELPDNNGPGPIVDLAATSSRRATLRFSFTAPGDDVEAGRAKGAASTYELRRGDEPLLDPAAFDRAEVVGAPPTPSAAGTRETIELEVALEDPRHFAVVARDDAGNTVLSNDVLAGATFRVRSAVGRQGAHLGTSLLVADLNGDGALELVAGAPGTDEVLIYDASVTLYARLTGPRGFGQAIAAADLDGDGGAELFVGAPLHDGERGAAYLFRFDGLRDRDASEADAAIFGLLPLDRLGAAVALGDANFDGVPDAVVGAPGDGAINDGAVIVLAGGDFTQRSTMRGGAPGDRFGSALACADLDGDGTAELVIGAPGADPAGNVDAGQVEIHGAAGVRILAGAQSRALFGHALAAGDADGDGIADLLVGAPFHDGASGRDAGAAFFFTGTSGDAAWSGEGRGADDHYGHAVAIAGPLLDGRLGALAIGAPGGRNRAGVVHGALHLIHLAAGGDFEANGIRYGAEAFDGFGAAIAPAGDVDGDGLHDLAAASPRADGAGSDAGSIHLLQ